MAYRTLPETAISLTYAVTGMYLATMLFGSLGSTSISTRGRRTRVAGHCFSE